MNQTNDVYVAESFDDYLEHHGIKGMHWGIRRTPEQLGHRVSKARERFLEYSEKAQAAGEAGKKGKLNRYSKKAEKTYKQEIKLNKQLEKALRKQVENDNEIVRKGDVDDVLKISDRLSEDQINTAIRRIQNQNRLRGLKEEDIAKVDKLIGMGKRIADISSQAYNIANNVRNFKNVMKDVQKDAIKEEEEWAKKQEIEKKEKRAKELDKIMRSGDMNKIDKVKSELSTTQMEDVYKRLYYNNKQWVDEALETHDERLMKTYSHLLGYSPLFDKKKHTAGKSDKDDKD